MTTINELTPDTPTISKRLMINFGKYKDKTVEEVANTDFGYCKWLLTQSFTPNEIKDYIKSNVNVNDYFMRWGKYKSKTITWIKQNDEKYIEWLTHNQFVKDKCPKLLEALISLY